VAPFKVAVRCAVREAILKGAQMRIHEITSNETLPVCYRKLIFLFALICVLIPASAIAAGGEVTLAWDANSEPDVAGYKLHLGTVSGHYMQSIDVGNTTQATINGLEGGVTYYFAATAYNDQAGESGFSAEVSYTVPAPDSDGDGVADGEDAFPFDPSETLDTDGDGTGNNADEDDDNDGMPDVWEISYGLNPLVNDADEDFDGDGVGNLNEYLAGTAPDSYEDAFVPETPILLSPINNAVVSLTPELETDAFYDQDPGDLHARSQWRIFRASDNFCVFDVTSSTSLTMLKVPRLILEEDTDYNWQVRFFNNRNAATEWSEVGAFTTDFANDDLDGNGVLDHQEVDGTLDLDHDGVMDREQADIKCVATGIGDFKIGISIRENDNVDSIVSIESEDPDDTDPLPPSLDSPNYLAFGLIHFKLVVKNPGDEVVVTIYLSKAAYDDGNWYKYNPVNDEWMDYSDYTDFSADRLSVYLRIKDGGFGDTDGIENGIIVDPLALGTAIDHNSGSNDFFVEDVVEGILPDLGCFISTAASRSANNQPWNLWREIRGRELSILFILAVLAYVWKAVYLRIKQQFGGKDKKLKI
jgi:chitinase